jgi:hypothetical protein
MSLFRRVSSIALVVLAAGTLAFAGEAQVLSGKVTAVSGRTVTVASADGNAWTFAVSPGAKVIAPGGSHRSDALESAGKLKTIDAFVRENQRVVVTFKEEGGTRYIEKLRVL